MRNERILSAPIRLYNLNLSIHFNFAESQILPVDIDSNESPRPVSIASESAHTATTASVSNFPTLKVTSVPVSRDVSIGNHHRSDMAIPIPTAIPTVPYINLRDSEIPGQLHPPPIEMLTPGVSA